MAFPKKNILRAIGWKDMGWTAKTIENGRYVEMRHEFCGNRLKIGKEKDIIFRFCSVCMVRIMKEN